MHSPHIVQIFTAAPRGADSLMIEMEVQTGGGLPAFVIVGLPDTAVQEARERVRSAILQSGFRFPRGRIVVNLSPAHLKKEGSHYDLPIAMGILLSSGQITLPGNRPVLAFGELSLSGAVRPIPRAFSLISGIFNVDATPLFLPEPNVESLEGKFNLKAYSLSHLKDLHQLSELNLRSTTVDYQPVNEEALLEDVRGQHQAKIALMIAAAGEHNLILAGPPGSGKTMLAQRVQSLLPDLNAESAARVARIHSLSEITRAAHQRPPVRIVHSSIPRTGLVGGGAQARPGEITLAHAGVLILDEMLEFHPQTLECLRQPLSDGYITHSRLKQTLKWPSKFMLIGTLNPCGCGHFGSAEHSCRCSKSAVKRYQARLSGPLQDRMDLSVYLHPSSALLQTSESARLTTHYCRQKVQKARHLQFHRFGIEQTNAEGCIHQILDSGIASGVYDDMQNRVRKLGGSARSFNQMLRVARTVADLQNSTSIETEHSLIALEYLRSPWRMP